MSLPGLVFILAAFFYPSSEKDLNKEFIGRVAKEESSILFATSRLTEKKVIAALIKAHLRGVKVEVVVDQKGARKNSSIWRLVDEGVPVYFWGEKGRQMKHKFCLFHEKDLWQGPHSFNAKHREGAFVLEENGGNSALLKEFNKLKEEGQPALSIK